PTPTPTRFPYTTLFRSEVRGPVLSIEYNEVLAAGPDGRSRCVQRRGRKVRTPQSSVPDNVREGGFKSTRRKVPQKTYRLKPAFRSEEHTSELQSRFDLV